MVGTQAFSVGDTVERRNWVGMTKGRIVEVDPDGETILVEWRVGFRMAGSRTVERPGDLRKSL